MLFQRIAGVCLLIGMAGFAAERFFPPQPVIVVWLTLVFCVLAIIFMVVGLIMRRRGGNQ